MKPDQSFLLMSHKDRYDLPKGHMEVGETEQQTALRGKLIN
jgi:8-oxo-dGTP pyrophosphatase MutT (NUDIX family)